MDRRRRPAALALALALAGLAASDAPPLAEMRWLAPGADVVQALGWQPPECLVRANSAEQAVSMNVGRVAFRSPLTLGGQAARAGISCESCHRNGRANPAFAFPGVSGPPGTADVTSSLFSSHRGNGVDDPVPIPDLAGPRGRLKVSRDPQSRVLETFIRGLIVEEFDGPEPTPAVLEGLAAYVRGLDAGNCPHGPEQVQALEYMSQVFDAARAAGTALRQGDQATAIAMIAAGRARLGRIDERYAGLRRAQTALRRADADLAALAASVRTNDGQAGARLEAFLLSQNDLEPVLRRDESRSLFNPGRLARAARLPAGGR